MDFFEEDNSQNTIQKLDFVCKEIAEIREEIAKQKEVLKKLNEIESELEQQMVRALTASNRTSYQSPYGTLSVAQRLSVSLPKDDKEREDFFNYLKDTGMFDTMITVNSNTLNSWYKAKKEELEEQGCFDFMKIPGLPEPRTMEIIQFRKGKK